MRRPAIGFCFPGYRYCGPGCSGPGAPTNPVDNCCLNHDACYAYGYDKQYCDAIFQHCLHQYKNPSTKMGRDANLFSRATRLTKALKRPFNSASLGGPDAKVNASPLLHGGSEMAKELAL